MPPLSYVEGSILFPTDAVPTVVSTGEPGLRRILEQEAVWAEQANALRARDRNAGGSSSCSSACRSLAGLVLLGTATASRRAEAPRGAARGGLNQAAVLWSAWRATSRRRTRTGRRPQRLGAIELRADGRDRPRGLRIVRRQDAMDLPTETDQDFMWLLFGRGAALEEISVKRPKARKAARPGGWASA